MSDWLPSLNALRAFEVTARHLSYQRAAQELNVTAPAVKQLVDKLETALGVSLLRRDGRGLALTEQGARGCKDITSAMRLLENAVQSLRADSVHKRLVVSVEASLASSWLVPRLQGFRHRHPDVTVLIDSNQTVVDLNSGQIDVAIRYGVETPDAEVHRLFDDEIFPVCSPAFLAGSGPLETLADLAHVPLIHWDVTPIPWARETRRWFTWESWMAHAGVSPCDTSKGLYFSEYGQAVQAAIAGQGVLLASWPILRDTLDSGLLVAPFAERVSTDIGFEIATTRTAAKRAEVVAFVDWVREQARLAAA